MEQLSGKAKAFLRGSVRKGWRYYSLNRKDCLKSKVCAKCNKKKKDVKADHIDPVGSFIPEDNPFIVRMFCDRENLQPLCDECHNLKTALERKARKKVIKKSL